MKKLLLKSILLLCALVAGSGSVWAGTVKYYVNGSVFDSEELASGSHVVFPTTIPTTLGGKTFVGWTDAAIDGTQNSAPATLIKAAETIMGASDINYYAVYANTTDIELENSTITSNASGKTSYKDDYDIDGWTGRYMVNNNKGVYSLQLGYNTNSSKTAYNCHLTTPSCSGNIVSITINTQNGTVSGRTFYLCSANNIGAVTSTESATYGYGSTTSANGSVTIRCTDNTTRFHIYPNGTAYIGSITLTHITTTPAYCTDVNVAITPGKTYTTLTYAYPLDFTNVSGLEAYIATSVSENKVQMVQVNKVPANKGLVLKATTPGSAVNVPIFDGTGADDVSANKMAGSATSTTAIDENGGYILKDGVFHPASAGTLAAGKAYLNITVSARELELSFDESDVTAISEVTNTNRTNNTNVYDLQGRKVAQPTKGLYIVNGKKVIIK